MKNPLDHLLYFIKTVLPSARTDFVPPKTESNQSSTNNSQKARSNSPSDTLESEFLKRSLNATLASSSSTSLNNKLSLPVDSQGSLHGSSLSQNDTANGVTFNSVNNKHQSLLSQTIPIKKEPNKL